MPKHKSSWNFKLKEEREPKNLNKKKDHSKNKVIMALDFSKSSISPRKYCGEMDPKFWGNMISNLEFSTQPNYQTKVKTEQAKFLEDVLKKIAK